MMIEERIFRKLCEEYESILQSKNSSLSKYCSGGNISKLGNSRL